MEKVTMRVTVHVPTQWLEELVSRGWSKTAATKLIRREVEMKAQDAVSFSALDFFEDGEPYLDAV